MLSIIVVLVFIAAMAALYVWTRRTESDVIYESQTKSEEQASALRLGIVLNASNGNFTGN